MMETEYVSITTPLAETTGQALGGLDDVVIVNVLRAATPFVEGLVEAMKSADPKIADEHVEKLDLLERPLKPLIQRAPRLVIGEECKVGWSGCMVGHQWTQQFPEFGSRVRPIF
jgi:hypothetical protein